MIGAIGSIGNAVDRFSSGDVLGGVLALAQAGADLYMVGKFGKSCFTARMRIKVRGAKKLAMDVQEGDEVATRNEFDPHGAVVYREVEEVYVRVAHILNVEVAGQIIETTAEHPFYVVGRGWIPAQTFCALAIC